MTDACRRERNRKFHLRWDSEDRNLIKEAIIYTFPLFQSDSPQVVYEASKFMVALINANRTNKSIHQRIDDCRAWRSSGQSYKVRAETLFRAFTHFTSGPPACSRGVRALYRAKTASARSC